MAEEIRARVTRRLATIALPVAGVSLALWLELLAAASFPMLSLTPFSLAVAISAWYGGFLGGATALLLSALGIDYFLLEPGTLLTLESPRQAFTFSVYVAGWLTFCAMAGRAYRRMLHDGQARLDAERVARQSDRLAQLTAALGQARTPAAVMDATVQESMHALTADGGMMLLVCRDGSRAEPVRALGYSAEHGEMAIEWVLDTRTPVADAVGRGAPVILESRARRSSEYPGLDERFYRTDCEATVAVPLLVGSRVVAVLRLDFREPQRFTADDRDYLFSVGPRSAQALDRTWQYEAAERARIEAESLRARADQELSERQKVELALRASEGRYRALAARTSRLHGLTAALSEAVTVQAVARAVVRHGRIVVGATTAVVTLIVDEGAQFESVYSETETGEPTASRRYAADKGLCETQAVETRRPVFVRSFAEWQERFWQSASIAADGGFVSSAALPLMVEGAAIGALIFYFTAPVNFDDAYQALLISVAQHCAQALDRARLYEAAQHARAEAEDANRLKDEFVSVVSHELRTPLNAMLGWTSMLQRSSLDSATAARALQSIHDNATRQARLIDELLDFSRILGGGIRLDAVEIDVRDLMRAVVESMIPAAAGQGVDLRLFPVPPVIVRGDVRRLEQVFFNLIGNAIKFTPDGGRVAIEAAVAEPWIELRVIDNGAGIEPAFLPHAFERFRQGDSSAARNHGGLGLGLSIARQLVEAHDGTIAVDSAGPGQGATFTVRLPIAGHLAEQSDERPPAPAMDRQEADSLARLDGVRVLVVDDEADTREIVAHALERCGAKVTMAASACDAIQVLERDEMDVLLADIAMPGENGYDLIRKVRTSVDARVASIPAAAVTAHAREEERRQALDAGFQLHLAKPFEPAQLMRTVETLARRSPAVQ